MKSTSQFPTLRYSRFRAPYGSTRKEIFSFLMLVRETGFRVSGRMLKKLPILRKMIRYKFVSVTRERTTRHGTTNRNIARLTKKGRRKARDLKVDRAASK